MMDACSTIAVAAVTPATVASSQAVKAWPLIRAVKMLARAGAPMSALTLAMFGPVVIAQRYQFRLIDTSAEFRSVEDAWRKLRGRDPSGDLLMLVRILTAALTIFGGLPAMAEAQLRPVTLPGTPAAAGQPWRPRLQLFEQATAPADRKRPVLYIHGGTFGSENSIFFRFGGRSWADELNDAGFSVWGLDFAGFGRSGDLPRNDRGDAALPESL